VREEIREAREKGGEKERIDDRISHTSLGHQHCIQEEHLPLHQKASLRRGEVSFPPLFFFFFVTLSFPLSYLSFFFPLSFISLFIL
jgi:hypothetical protein